MKKNTKIALIAGAGLLALYVYRRKKQVAKQPKKYTEQELAAMSSFADCQKAGGFWERPFGGTPRPAQCMTAEQKEADDQMRKRHQEALTSKFGTGIQLGDTVGTPVKTGSFWEDLGTKLSSQDIMLSAQQADAYNMKTGNLPTVTMM